MSHLARQLVLVPLAAASLAGAGCGPRAQPEVVAKYEQYCAACHASGAAGAPRKGDADSWRPRLDKGEAKLVESVREGIAGMPAMGLCAECSDEEFRALVEYMSR